MLFGRLNLKIQVAGKITTIEEDGVSISAGSFESLMSKVNHHRLEEGGDLSPGWQHRLGTKVVEDNPKATAHCSVPESSANYRVKMSGGDIANFIFSMKRWAMTGGAVVDDDEAERRASICSVCPHNSELTIGCSSCMQILPKIMGMIKGRTTSYHDQLESCDRCSCALKAKVWLPMNVLSGGRALTLPKECFMKGHVTEISISSPQP